MITRRSENEGPSIGEVPSPPDSVGCATLYKIDSEDRLTVVDTAWLRFARQNGGVRLERESVVGRPLWDFVAGAETRRIYRLMFRRIRSDGSGVSVPFRCDSPSMRRLMVLELSSNPEGGIELKTKLIRNEPRDPVPLLNPAFPRTDDFLTICSWCKQVLLPTGRWATTENAISKLGLFLAPQLPRLTQGICPTCEGRIRAL